MASCIPERANLKIGSSWPGHHCPASFRNRAEMPGVRDGHQGPASRLLMRSREAGGERVPGQELTSSGPRIPPTAIVVIRSKLPIMNSWSCLIPNQISGLSKSVFFAQTDLGSPGPQERSSTSPPATSFSWSCCGLNQGPSDCKTEALLLSCSPLSKYQQTGWYTRNFSCLNFLVSSMQFSMCLRVFFKTRLPKGSLTLSEWAESMTLRTD